MNFKIPLLWILEEVPRNWSAPEKATVLNIGSVSLTERFFSVKPLNRIEKLGLLNHISKQLEHIEHFLKEPYDGLIFTAGTPVSLAFMEHETDDANKIHGKTFKTERVDFWFDKLSSMSLEERKKIPFLPKYRVDVIVSGVAIFKADFVFNKQRLFHCIRHRSPLRTYSGTISIKEFHHHLSQLKRKTLATTKKMEFL